MKYPIKSLVVAIIFALCFSAIFVSPAFAEEGDGTVPVEPTTVTESEEPGDDSAPVEDEDAPVDEAAPADETDPADESAPVEEPAPTDENAPADETTPADETAPADEAAPADETAPADEAAPADETAPADEDAGEEVNEEPEVAEAEAADEPSAPVLADPIWCPSSVSMPVSSGAGCTASYASLEDLITYLSANQPTVAGTIWIEKTYDSSVNDAGETVFTLDGSVLTTMANAALTIKGGWNGIGTNTIDTTSPSLFDGASLNILNWNNTVTINDLEFVNATVGTTLVVSSTKNITLLRITTNDSNGSGALLDTATGTGDVSVTNSQFNGSTIGHGLVILANGAITLNGVQGHENGLTGAYIDNSIAPVAKPVTIVSGVNEFSDNGAVGLLVNSKGVISLKDLTVIGNGTTGAYLDNLYSTTAQGIVLSGTNVFGANGNGGLYAASEGPITANSLIAIANGGHGVSLDNDLAATAQPIKLTGTNEFKYNGSRGLNVYSRGLITLNNLDANENSGGGAAIVNSTSPTNQAVTMTGINNFNGNGDTGLSIDSAGVVTLNTITAWDNSYIGVFVDNTYSAAARAVVVNGKLDTSNNNSLGVEIDSHGAITITNLTADNNGNSGAELYNDEAPSAQAITLKGPVKASNNGYTGLLLMSKGVISLSNVTADGNSNLGAALNNSAGLAAVTVSGTNSFSGNSGGTGLQVNSNGAITVSNVTANGNNGNGAELYNGGTGLADILVSGVNVFNNNSGYGLYLEGRKNVTVQNVTANDNGNTGLHVQNDAVGSVGKVTVAATIKDGTNDFYDNGGNGVVIYSLGSVTLTSVQANGNLGFGALIQNISAASPQAVTFTGVNEFSSNGSNGVLVNSKGAVTLNSVEANANGNLGVYIENTYSGTAAPQNVTINGYLEASDNFYSGVEIYTYGAITITNLSANYNGLGEVDDNDKFGFGALLQNQNGTLARAVTLKGTQYYEGNWTGGLWVDSRGVISVNNLTAYLNEGIGAGLYNNYSGTNAITLTGDNLFAANAGAGLDVHSLGAVTINNLLSFYNGDHGAFIDNRYGGIASLQNVTLNGYVEVYGNFYSGLEVYSHGIITVTNVYADDNGRGEPDDNDKYGYGVYLNNNQGGAPRAVVVKAVAPKKQPLPDNVFSNNWTGGLVIESRGAITVANLYVDGNELIGVDLNNDIVGAVGGVNLTGYADIYYTNAGPGLDVDSRGLITLANADISYNAGGGAWLTNTNGTLGVTLSGTNNFDQNGDTGLTVYTNGAIAANNLGADFNSGGGAYLDNLSGTGAVTLTGAASFDSNNGIGLDIESSRAITINATLLATSNGSTGVYLDNTTLGDALPHNISLNGTTNAFYNNAGTGLELYSNGVVTAKNLVAEGNSVYGVSIQNLNSVAPKAVTLVGPLKVNDNNWDGLNIDSHGAVKLQDITANNNGENGVRINNQQAGAVGGVTIGGTNLFSGNGDNGLNIASHGAVTLNNLRAEYNGDRGVRIHSESPNTAAVPVKITGVNVFNYNGMAGLRIDTDSAITLNSITAIGNGVNDNGGGVSLDNYSAWIGGAVIAQPTITITGITLLKDNTGVGMYFNSVGAVTLSRIIADNNSSHGLNGETDKTITITCGSMNLNGGNGWRLRSWLGQTVTLKGVYAIANTLGNTNLQGGTLVTVRTC